MESVSFLFVICLEIDRLIYLQCMFSIHKAFFQHGKMKTQ